MPVSAGAGFRHEALLYAGDQGFLRGTLPFIRQGVTAGEPVKVVVAARKIDLLRDALGRDADDVQFADMAVVGRNPARIIPAWQEFAGRHLSEGRPFRGVGEPVGPERGTAELLECHRHESLLNIAFADRPGAPWSLLCPYDTDVLDEAVVEEAYRTHPHLSAADGSTSGDRYEPVDPRSPFAARLDEPAVAPSEMPFEHGSLADLRRAVAWHAEEAGLDTDRAEDFVLGVNEVATNSLRHGGGVGTLRLWEDSGAVVCEVRDRGHIRDPLVGREMPPLDRPGGRGLWLANQLCDLVQLHSSAAGTAVRLHMRVA